ncbi:MAG: polysaccharide deacetylase family protein [Myxococcota bacterium]
MMDAPAGRPSRRRAALDLGLRLWAPLFRRRSGLRVLAYHTVPDRRSFAAQLDHLGRHYEVVTAQQVVDALSGASLPGRAVWLTFDDGDPSVLSNGLPELRARGLTATLFVCPSVVGTQSGLWFQRARASMASEAEVAALKSLSPADRASHIAQLPDAPFPQPTRDDLVVWTEAGCTVGNHTWSHPLLDQCEPGEVASEIDRAQEWLDEHFPGQPRVFAYPNGNWTDSAERVLTQRGYALALLFDHQLADLSHPLRVSRIRVNTFDSMPRFSAAVSGVHPALLRARTALRR